MTGAFRSVLCVLALIARLPVCAADRPVAPVTACAFSPDGASLVVAHHDTVVVHAAKDGAIGKTLSGKALGLKRVTALAFSPDGRLLAIAGGVPAVSGRVVLWNRDKGSVGAEVDGFADLVSAVAFSRDGGQLAVGSADKSAHVYALRGGRVEPGARLVGHAGPVHAVAFSPDAKAVVTASGDRSLKVWEAASGRLLRTLGNHTDAVHGVAVRPSRPDGQGSTPWACASAGDDRTVRVWQPGIGRMVRIVRNHDGPIFAVAYARGGAVLLSAGAEGIVRAIDADADRVLFQWNAADDWIYALAVSPDGRTVATGDWAGQVRVWTLDETGAKRLW